MASAEALRLMNGKCSTLLNFRLQFSMARDLVEKRGKHWKRLLVCGLIFFCNAKEFKVMREIG